MKKIERYAFSEKPDLAFDYDPMGQRITKTVYPKSAPGVIDVAGVEKTYYTRDAQGNVMTVYTLKAEDGETNLYLTERNLYGSTRLGMEQVNQIVASTEPTNIDINTAQQRVVGDKRYEMQNHLNSVMVTVTDRKLPEYNATENLAYYKPDVVSYSDYMPFGMQMAERNGSTGDYRYGFQGQEKDDEIKGEGNSVNYKYRMHDPRVGRFFAVDPLAPIYPELTPYQFSSNSPIGMVEFEGLEGIRLASGQWYPTCSEYVKRQQVKIKVQNSQQISNKETMQFNNTAVSLTNLNAMRQGTGKVYNYVKSRTFTVYNTDYTVEESNGENFLVTSITTQIVTVQRAN